MKPDVRPKTEDRSISLRSPVLGRLMSGVDMLLFAAVFAGILIVGWAAIWSVTWFF